MLDRGRTFHDEPAVYDRLRFCERAGIDYANCVFQLIRYGDEQTYDRIVDVGSLDTTRRQEAVAGDGLFTTETGVGLFLPVADCVATVMYDPVQKILALLHIGRHATYADLAGRAIAHFKEKGSDPNDLIVWMSPSAKRETYSLDTFEHADDPAWQAFYDKRDGQYFLDLPGYNRERCIQSGVRPDNIVISQINTMTDANYFSHRAGDTDGRIAVLAMMR